jgi:hypothetical protein
VAGEKAPSPDHEKKLIESGPDYFGISGFGIRTWLPPTDVVGPPTDVVGPPTDVVGPPEAALGLGFAHSLSEKLIEGNVIIA